jgi:hypothetical protein
MRDDMMSKQEAMAAAERAIVFLETCGEADIEAGIGFVLVMWGERGAAQFKQKLADAIRGSDK